MIVLADTVGHGRFEFDRFHGHLAIKQGSQLVLQLTLAFGRRETALKTRVRRCGVKGEKNSHRLNHAKTTCVQWEFSIKAARAREISETWPQKGHWCRMEEDMIEMRRDYEKGGEGERRGRGRRQNQLNQVLKMPKAQSNKSICAQTRNQLRVTWLGNPVTQLLPELPRCVASLPACVPPLPFSWTINTTRVSPDCPQKQSWWASYSSSPGTITNGADRRPSARATICPTRSSLPMAGISRYCLVPFRAPKAFFPGVHRRSC